MKKKLLTITGAVLGLGLAFGAGNIYTKASSDWQTNAINSANAQINQVGQDKANSLANNVNTDINTTIQDSANAEIAAKQDELKKLLDQYYQMKLQGLTDSPEYKQLEQVISTIQQNAITTYEKQIDQAFAGK